MTIDMAICGVSRNSAVGYHVGAAGQSRNDSSCCCTHECEENGGISLGGIEVEGALVRPTAVRHRIYTD